MFKKKIKTKDDKRWNVNITVPREDKETVQDIMNILNAAFGVKDILSVEVYERGQNNW